ncbi:MAG TPA: hypothetical protein G4N93_02765 [Dehalococcoidia bacterium]|nr:hypothetical protein [Dehalococcoidia bacterium]
MGNRSTFGSVYFAIFGFMVLALGIVELVVVSTGGMEGASWGPLEMGGMLLWWRAIILVFAGLIYLSSVNNFLDVRQLGKSVIASIMIWIVAGMEIWARIAGSIPGGPEEGTPWFNPEFLATYGPPYMPEIYLLPLSLVILYFVGRRKKQGRLS